MTSADNNNPRLSGTKSPSELSYAEAITELETLVADLDDGTVDIDTLSEQFQRAIDIIEELDGRITATREKVDQLTPRLDNVINDRSDEDQ